MGGESGFEGSMFNFANDDFEDIIWHTGGDMVETVSKTYGYGHQYDNGYANLVKFPG